MVEREQVVVAVVGAREEALVPGDGCADHQGVVALGRHSDAQPVGGRAGEGGEGLSFAENIFVCLSKNCFIYILIFS